VGDTGDEWRTEQKSAPYVGYNKGNFGLRQSGSSSPCSTMTGPERRTAAILRHVRPGLRQAYRNLLVSWLYLSAHSLYEKVRIA
jgi:hypothetical protein